MAEIFAVAGGKGGSGKSVLSILLSRAFAGDEMHTVLIDGDLGGANLHTLLGMNYPTTSLTDFLTKSKPNLEDVMMMTNDKYVRLICGAGDVLGMANLKSTVKAKLIRHLHSLEADRVVLDLGAGSSYNVLDLFLAADRHILVVSTEPTSLQNVYEFLKFSVGRLLHTLYAKNVNLAPFIKRFVTPVREKGLHTVPELLKEISAFDKPTGVKVAEDIDGFRPIVIINMADSQTEALKYYNAIESTGKRYLKIKTRLAGTIFRGNEIRDAIKQRESLLTVKLGVNNYPLVQINTELKYRLEQRAAGSNIPAR
ncbi:MAG: P-loop NTPase [Nitrospinota bacterium]